MWVKEKEYNPKYNSVGVDQRWVRVGANVFLANRTVNGWITDAFNDLYGGCGLRTCFPDFVYDSDNKPK